MACLVPPLSGTARRFEYGEALQFSLLAIVVPASGRHRRPVATPRAGQGQRARSHRASPTGSPTGGCGTGSSPGLSSSSPLDLGAVVAWHAPRAVADVSEHGWLVPLEGVTLLVFGLGLWLELVASPPLVPRSGYLRRAVLAAFAMWTFWILAYVLGLSNHAFYPNFAHVPGGLSAAADQQVASAVLWFVAAASFVPVIFWNAMMWLRTDEDPDAELLALERAERRRGTPPLTGRQDGGTSSP